MECRTSKTAKNHPSPLPPAGLRELDKISLGARSSGLLKEASESCGGSAIWRKRKLVEARDLLALAQVAPRFIVHAIDLRETLRAQVALKVPVPLNPDERGELRVAGVALLGILYPEHAIREPLPGFAFIQIIRPLGVWHANVSAEGPQMLCLGAQLPVGIPCKDLVLLAYGALSMQTVMVDEADPAGVMNGEAALWWQQNMKLAPLSRARFLDPSP